jgi:hypothetical protein
MAELFGGHIVAKYLKEVEGVGAVFSLSEGKKIKIRYRSVPWRYVRRIRQPPCH